MESETIKNQLVVLFNNLKNIQPNERDNLITFMKKTLSQLQGDDERDNLYQNSNMNSDNYAYCCSGNAGDTTNNSSITNNSSTYQVHLKPSELYDLTSTNVDCLQLSSDATADSAPVEEVNNFSTLTTIHHHHNPTSLGDHDFSKAIDVNEFLSITTSAPTFHCSNLCDDLNLNETLQEQHPIRLDNTVTDSNSSSNPSVNYQVSDHYETYLNCPLCRVTFTNWPDLEHHLYDEHSTTNNVAPVCWRCQGVFKNHAVLIAHECFDWGRLYLPCTVYMNKSLKNFHKFSEAELKKKQFPVDGVFLSRRCGLCYKSNIIFTSHDAFVQHKSSSHPTTGRDSGYEPPTYPLPPPSTLTTHTSSSSLFLSARKKKHSLKSILPTEKHPSSDEAIRSIVRNLTERFYALNYHEKRWKRQKRRKKSNLDKNHDSSTEVIEANLTNDSSAGEEGKTQSNTTLVSTTSIDDSAVSNATTADSARVDIAISTPITNREEERTITTSPDITSSNNQENTKSLSTSYSPSTFLTSLLVAQRVKRNLELKNKRARRLKAVAFECDSTEKLVNDDGDEPLSTTTTVLSCDVPSSPSVGSYISEGEIQFFHNKRNLWFRRQNNRSAYKNRCLKLQPKRKTTFSAGRRKFETSALFTNTIKIRRFACNRCSAVFRLSSRLRAHYLFQHGHIPESLGGLSPRPNEILFNKQWNSRSSRSSSNHSTTNHDNDTANNTSDFTSYQEFSLHSSDNTNLTPKDNAVANLTVTSTTASPSIPDKSNCLSVSGLITRSRRRITTSSNNDSTTTMSTSIQSVNQSTQSSRRTKKQFTDTSMTDSNNDNNITSLLDEQSKTDEVSEKLLRKSNKFSKQHYCTECNTSFKSAYNLKRHRTIVHLHEYRYFCGYCEYRTGERLAYEEHLARHFCVKQFVCEICNARFTIKHELDDHIAFKHSDERNFPCTECDQRFKTSGTLWRHKKTHEKRVYHLCPICSTSFTRLSNLNRHLLRTHKQKHHRYQQQTNNTDSEILINSSNKKISTHQRTTTTTTTLNVNSKNKLSRSRQKCKNVSIDHGTNGLNQHDISSCQQQTVEQVIPVEIITPHLSTTGLSSDHHTVINIIADQDLRYSNIINISDNNLNKSVLINSSVSCADTSSSASSASSNIQSTTLSTQSHITVATTEAPIISTNLSGYQTVNLTDNSTVFMLNFSDLETNGHAYFEQADLLNDRHDNLQHNMLISVSDPIYHQATEFSNSLVVSTSSESSVGTLATSSSCSSSPPSGVPGSAITLQSNLLLPIQLTTNTFSPITSSSIIGSNGSVSCDGITNSSNNNPWSTTISFQPEPSLCYLITATEPIESDVLCDQINGQRNMITSTDNNSTNITSQTSNDLSLNPNIGSVNDADDDDDERNDVGGGSIIGDTSHSISSVDILNSLQSDVVDNMMNGAVLEIGCQSPQLTRNCIFYETCCSSALTSSHSPSVSMPISSCANSSTMSYPSVSQSVSIWRPVDSVDCGTSLLNKQQDQFFQIPVNSNCLTVDDNSNNHNSTSLPFTGVAADGYQVDHYGQRYHHIHNLFPLLSKSHDGFSEGDRNDIDDDDDGEEDSYYGGVAADNSIVTNNNRKDNRISTNLLDTSIMLSWNPSNDCNIINSNNNRPVELYNYSHCSPKFPSPDPNNLSPSPIHLDHQHQQSFELLSFQQSGHDHQQITSNLVPGFIGVSSSETFLSSSSTLSTTSSRSISSSTLYENHLVNDCTNFLGQFYHHHNTASVSNMNLPYKNNYNIPNIINSNMENSCFPTLPSTTQINDKHNDNISDDIVTDQCSNFSVGYLIGHSIVPSSSSSSSSSSSIVVPSSRCMLLQTEKNTSIISSLCSSSTDNLNYLNSSSPHLSNHNNLHHHHYRQQQQHDHTSLSQSNFSNESVDYEFIV